MYRHLLVFRQIHLGAAHGSRPGGNRDQVLRSQTAAVHRLHHQQEGHDLGDAGGLQLVVGVLFKEDGPRLLFHQDGGGGIHRVRAGGVGGEDQKRGGQQGRSYFFHRYALLQTC